MNEERPENPNPRIAPPQAILKKMRWPYPFIWSIPVVAAVIAGFYYYDQEKDRGIEITVKFSDASGLHAENTNVAHLGVGIGKITSIQLTPDQSHVLVKIQLQRTADAFAKKGSLFWIVRPEISAENITGLNTITTGPYIEAVPGPGDPATEFNGLEKAPNTLGEGLKITLHAPRLEHLEPDSPVYFRGIQVGIIHAVNLSLDANGIDVDAFIWNRYARLVRLSSRFWVVSGADVKGGIFTGVQFKLGSLRSIISGGVTFATPDAESNDSLSELARDGANFPLFDEPKKEWLNWSPRIQLPPENPAPDQRDLGLQQAAQSAVKPQ